MCAHWLILLGTNFQTFVLGLETRVWIQDWEGSLQWPHACHDEKTCGEIHCVGTGHLQTYIMSSQIYCFWNMYRSRSRILFSPSNVPTNIQYRTNNIEEYDLMSINVCDRKLVPAWMMLSHRSVETVVSDIWCDLQESWDTLDLPLTSLAPWPI